MKSPFILFYFIFCKNEFCIRENKHRHTSKSVQLTFTMRPSFEYIFRKCFPRFKKHNNVVGPSLIVRSTPWRRTKHQKLGYNQMYHRHLGSNKFIFKRSKLVHIAKPRWNLRALTDRFCETQVASPAPKF